MSDIGFEPSEEPTRKWFDVRAGPESSSTGTYLTGLEFTIFSISIGRLRKPLSYRVSVEQMATDYFLWFVSIVSSFCPCAVRMEG